MTMATAISPQSLEYLRKRRETPSFGANGFSLDELRRCLSLRNEPVGLTARYTRTRIGDIPAEWVQADNADPDVRLLYLHGGGYVSGSGAFFIAMATRLSAAAQCAVLLLDYRLAPEHRFPAGLEDAVRAHEWVRANGPYGPTPAKSTFIAGDSAGGGLTLATVLALRDRKGPLPRAAIPLSPWADMTLSGQSIRSQAELDPIMHPNCLPEFVSLYMGDNKDFRNPLASPIFGNYTGIPPLLIQVGELEIIRDDSVRAAAKAKADGVDVTLEIWPGMVHDFHCQVEPPLPEGQEAINHIGDFIKRHRVG